MMKALKRMQEQNVVDKKECKSINDWDKWVAWLQERQEAIDNAKTPQQKAAVAAQYQRSYKGQM
jgi:hypothetical protein